MNALAEKLGLSKDVQFYDIEPLGESNQSAHIPRPAYALLASISHSRVWHLVRRVEDATKAEYAGRGDGEPVVWFKHMIENACSSIGFLHCAINSPASAFIVPDSPLEKIRADAIPLRMFDRSRMLRDSRLLKEAHQSVATASNAVDSEDCSEVFGRNFVAFVKADDGHLWELDSSRNGPFDRGLLGENEDVLSPHALDLGLGKIVRMDKETGEGELRFRCTALAPKAEGS